MGPRTAVQPRLKVVEDQPWEAHTLAIPELLAVFRTLLSHKSPQIFNTAICKSR